MSNVIIIGNGPAGISAGLYTTRAGIDTTIIGKDYGALEKAAEIENYYGFGEPVSGKTLVRNGLKNIKRLGAQVITDEVLSFSYGSKKIVKTKNNEFMADSIILATGSSRAKPGIKNLTAFEGRGVSYCAACDGFFHRGKDVAVLGSGDYALHEALELLELTSSVTLLTNGQEVTASIPDGIKINTKKIHSLAGKEGLESVVFEDDSSLSLSGLFVAIGVAGSADLAVKLGVMTDKRLVLTDENMATNIPGVFAAGDCTGGLLQISKAVYEGAKAGTGAIDYIRNLPIRKTA
ncbi:MAG: NAD(P)/FAD-dependent oxidoreductase [Eubacteriaceae bacterium]|jgi:thioredoxin reductase (NADPH)